ncbi:unnamed protein product [Ambrosiozyma monospora]|uniref:Inactive metallocarboxypeptidase ECM14 n=1 Tax=Ambrosiozyma monospora TaxID=43982 RepID=A0A9W7DHR7_AMBMO|nr:unnamed protein product [Ambrosiozyma monospora]
MKLISNIVVLNCLLSATTTAFNIDVLANPFNNVQKALQIHFNNNNKNIQEETWTPSYETYANQFLDSLESANFKTTSDDKEFHHWSSITTDDLPFDIQQYVDRYVIRLHNWDSDKTKEAILLSSHELGLDIWETSMVHKFVDVQVTKFQAVELFKLIMDHYESAHFELNLMIHDLPQTIFETLPIASKTLNEDEVAFEDSNAGFDASAVEMFFKKYRDLKTIYNWFDLLEQTYPELLTVERIGQTFEGRDIKALRLTAHKNDSKKVKTVVITGESRLLIHASDEPRWL